jgi:membrane-associated phospholipid phosphatase
MFMTQQQYERLSARFSSSGRKRALVWANRMASLSVYAVYCLSCLQLLIRRDARLIAMVLICGIPFVAVSLIRKHIDAPRPYEALDITPLIPREKKGCSFPSRHVFSAFVIATALCLVSLPLAIFVALAGCVLMCTRVIGGIHFPKDVIAGAFIGVTAGAAGILLWKIAEGLV